MDIKKIVLAVALMLGMAAGSVQAVNGLDLVKRALCIGGGSISGLLSVGTIGTGYLSFKATDKHPSDIADGVINVGLLGISLFSWTTALTSGILMCVLLSKGFKK